MNNNYIITIARGFGTGGKQIAMKLADELGINCYENRLGQFKYKIVYS